jgi:hypothetical protein
MTTRTIVACDGKSYTFDPDTQGVINHADGSITFRPLTEAERRRMKERVVAVMDAADAPADDAATKRLNDVLEQLAVLGSDTVSLKALLANGSLKPAQAALELCKALGLDKLNSDPLSTLEGFSTARLQMRSDDKPTMDATDSVSRYLRGDNTPSTVATDSVSRYLAGMKPDYSHLDTVSRYLAERAG